MREKAKNDKWKNQDVSAEIKRYGINFTIIGLAMLVFAFLSALLYWNYNRAPAPEPESRMTIPTARPTTEAFERNLFWSTWIFFEPTDALELREQPNVVNCALIAPNGAVRFSLDRAVTFTGENPWKQSERPYGLDTLTLQGTVISIVMDGWNFPVVLNAHQPFVLENEPTKVYIVSLDGKLWSASAEQVAWIDISTAQAQLPQELAPNPRLSVSLR